MWRLRSRGKQALQALQREATKVSVQVATRLPDETRASLDLPETIDDIVPSEDQLKRWAATVGLEYGAWSFYHSFMTLEQWRAQRQVALDRGWQHSPLLSVVTPVYNTPVEFLREAVYSVRVQSNPYWELCLVNDASTDPDTLAELARIESLDSRIKVRHLEVNTGICGATNAGVEMASGEYVAFLDHDDRLAPEALHHVGVVVTEHPTMDIVYSDRDMLTPDNFRTDPTFKPDWAPETLLSGNFLFHLTVYRRTLIERLGGLRQEFEGSQDLDLALRAAETDPVVGHIPLVLYHWRQHEDSMALRPDLKPHIFAAGKAAVDAALDRRRLVGEVNEIPDIWRGNYRVRLRPSGGEPEIVKLRDNSDYRSIVRDALEATSAETLIVLGPDLTPVDDEALGQLATWLQIDGVVAATGRVVSLDGKIRHAGLARREGGVPLSLYDGCPMDEPGYAATTLNIRNVSLAHPMCVAWSSDAMRNIARDGVLAGPHAGLDWAMQLVRAGGRIVYNPLATFTSDDVDFAIDQWSAHEAITFETQWAKTLQTDPYLNPAHRRDRIDMSLNIGCPPLRADW